jgi:putative FmdB family regulatory protein
MPTYIYECKACEHSFEEWQKMTDDPLKKCPECGKKKLFKVLTGGIHGFVSGSETIGGLADKNARENKSKIAEAEAKKRESTPQAPKAWYDKYGTATPKEINKMTPQQKTRYIMEGRK